MKNKSCPQKCDFLKFLMTVYTPIADPSYGSSLGKISRIRTDPEPDLKIRFFFAFQELQFRSFHHGAKAGTRSYSVVRLF